MLITRGSHWSGAEYATGNWSEGRGARRDLQGHRMSLCCHAQSKSDIHSLITTEYIHNYVADV